jgi:hypothetical protein
MDRRARQTHLAPCYVLHLECQGVPRAQQSLSSILEGAGQGPFNIPNKLDCTIQRKPSDEQNNPTYILSQTTLNRHSNGGSVAYLQYIRHVTSQAAALATSAGGSELAPGYADYLQAPLQPLMDDLGSATYDVFERDPVKYTQYEEAILLALGDLPAGEKQ